MKRILGDGSGQGDLFSVGVPAPPVPPVATPARPAAVPLQPATAPLQTLAAPTSPWRAPAPAAPKVELPRVTPSVLTVSELTRRIKGALEARFTRVMVRGEISGFRGANARGHLYFNLKDEDACLEVCVWASTAQRMRFQLREGLTVVVEGNVDVYAPRGRYSLIVQRIEPEGEGALALAFQQLKERLSQEGLMGENRRRPLRELPLLPRRIGVVTSKTGAALQDFLRVLHGRHPRLSVVLSDARVQGEGSALEVCRALERLYRIDVDVIVVTRGGGSLEDLWTFNEESVARAMHASPVPIVSAVGHEIDFTIADFVADWRAPTPSAAAERLAPVLSELELSLKNWQVRLHRGIERVVLEQNARLHRLEVRLPDVGRRISGERQRIADASDRMSFQLRTRLRKQREELQEKRERLARQQPQTRLRGQKERLRALSHRLAVAMRNRLAQARRGLNRSRLTLAERSPHKPLMQARQDLTRLNDRIPALARERVALRRATLQTLAARLEAMSPLSVLARGYSLTTKASDGKLVRRAADVREGDRIVIRVAGDGRTLEHCQTIEAVVSEGTPTRSS